MKKILYALMLTLISVGANAQILPRYTENEKAAVNVCKSLDDKILKDIKAKMIATGTIGIASTIGNITSLGITAANKNQKDTGTGLAATIATGVATAGSGVNTTLSGLSLADLNNLIETMQKCQDSLSLISSSQENNTQEDNTQEENTNK